MSEVKKTDHSADVLASIKSQVPMVVDKYLGTKLDDALLRIFKRRTADLIEKYSMKMPWDNEVEIKVNLLRKDDDQSSKKPRESDASASKQHPTLTLIGWQITDTRDAVVDSSTHRSDLKSEHSEQSMMTFPMLDEQERRSSAKADLEGPWRIGMWSENDNEEEARLLTCELEKRLQDQEDLSKFLESLCWRGIRDIDLQVAESTPSLPITRNKSTSESRAKEMRQLISLGTHIQFSCLFNTVETSLI
ncbi:hypothetical protein Tco_0619802 [Tanacetum coccineum]